METMTGFLFLKVFFFLKKMSRSVYFGMEIDANSKPCLHEGLASPSQQRASVGLA